MKAKKDLSNLGKKISVRILDKLDFFIYSGKPLKYAKKLTDHDTGTYRFRVGNYRAIFDIDKKGKITVLLVLRVKHRKEVYL